MDTTLAICISILVIVSFILLFLIEIYRKILNIFEFYSPEAPPPLDFRFSNSFIDSKHKHTPIVVQ